MATKKMAGKGRKVKAAPAAERVIPEEYYARMPAAPRESAEALADRRDLLKAVHKSSGFRLFGEIVGMADALDRKVVEFLEDHGPGSGSPLARWSRRHDGACWKDAECLLYMLRHVVGSMEAEMPPRPMK